MSDQKQAVNESKVGMFTRAPSKLTGSYLADACQAGGEWSQQRGLSVPNSGYRITQLILHTVQANL